MRRTQRVAQGATSPGRTSPAHDSPLIRPSASIDIRLLAGTFGYDLDDLAAFQINAALGSFLPLEDREEIIATITAGHQEA